MFGIGMGELLVIAVILVIAVGPDKMPTFLKSVVAGWRQFQRTSRDLRSAVAIDAILDDKPAVRRAGPPPLQLTSYEVQRENPRFGPDQEHAFSLQAKEDTEHRREYPAEGPDVLAALAGERGDGVPGGGP